MTDLPRYMAALHAMQSGVAAEMDFNTGPTQTKHLRTGINAAMSDICGLVTLLIAKGIFTEEEYVAALADAMEREKTKYEKLLSEHYGTKITLA